MNRLTTKPRIGKYGSCVSPVFLLWFWKRAAGLPYFAARAVVSQTPDDQQETTAPVAQLAASRLGSDIAIQDRAFWDWPLWNDKSLLNLSLLTTRAERATRHAQGRKRALKRA
jgi:hypothetical protein